MMFSNVFLITTGLSAAFLAGFSSGFYYCNKKFYPKLICNCVNTSNSNGNGSGSNDITGNSSSNNMTITRMRNNSLSNSDNNNNNNNNNNSNYKNSKNLLNQGNRTLVSNKFYSKLVKKMIPIRCVRRMKELQLSHQLEEEEQNKCVIFESKAVILILDIKGFTQLSERFAQKQQVEKFSDIVNALFSGLIDILERHKGYVESFNGDAIIVFFYANDYDDHLDNLINPLLKPLRYCLQAVHYIKNSNDYSPWRSTSDNVELRLHGAVAVGSINEMYLGGYKNRYLTMAMSKSYAELSEALDAAGDNEFVLAPSAVEILKMTSNASGAIETVTRDFQDPGSPLQKLSNNIITLFVKILPSRLLPSIVDDNKNGKKMISYETTSMDYLNFLSSTVFDENNDDVDKNNFDKEDNEDDEEMTKFVSSLIPPEYIIERFKSTSFASSGNNMTMMMNERRNLIVLFMSLSSDNSVEELQDLILFIQEEIDSKQGIIRQLCEDDKGVVLIACFGYPYHADDCLRAVMTALHIVGFSKKCRIGITVGDCFTGSCGDFSKRFEWSVIGATVNLAARLSKSKSNPHEPILVTEQVMIRCLNENGSNNDNDNDNDNDNGNGSMVRFHQSEKPIVLKGILDPVFVFVPELKTLTDYYSIQVSNHEIEPNFNNNNNNNNNNNSSSSNDDDDNRKNNYLQVTNSLTADNIFQLQKSLSHNDYDNVFDARAEFTSNVMTIMGLNSADNDIDTRINALMIEGQSGIGKTFLISKIIFSIHNSHSNNHSNNNSNNEIAVEKVKEIAKFHTCGNPARKYYPYHAATIWLIQIQRVFPNLITSKHLKRLLKMKRNNTPARTNGNINNHPKTIPAIYCNSKPFDQQTTDQNFDVSYNENESEEREHKELERQHKEQEQEEEEEEGRRATEMTPIERLQLTLTAFAELMKLLEKKAKEYQRILFICDDINNVDVMSLTIMASMVESKIEGISMLFTCTTASFSTIQVGFAGLKTNSTAGLPAISTSSQNASTNDENLNKQEISKLKSLCGRTVTIPQLTQMQANMMVKEFTGGKIDFCKRKYLSNSGGVPMHLNSILIVAYNQKSAKSASLSNSNSTYADDEGADKIDDKYDEDIDAENEDNNNMIGGDEDGNRPRYETIDSKSRRKSDVKINTGKNTGNVILNPVGSGSNASNRNSIHNSRKNSSTNMDTNTLPQLVEAHMMHIFNCEIDKLDGLTYNILKMATICSTENGMWFQLPLLQHLCKIRDDGTFYQSLQKLVQFQILVIQDDSEEFDLNSDGNNFGSGIVDSEDNEIITSIHTTESNTNLKLRQGLTVRLKIKSAMTLKCMIKRLSKADETMMRREIINCYLNGNDDYNNNNNHNNNKSIIGIIKDDLEYIAIHCLEILNSVTTHTNNNNGNGEDSISAMDIWLAVQFSCRLANDLEYEGDDKAHRLWLGKALSAIHKFGFFNYYPLRAFYVEYDLLRKICEADVRTIGIDAFTKHLNRMLELGCILFDEEDEDFLFDIIAKFLMLIMMTTTTKEQLRRHQKIYELLQQKRSKHKSQESKNQYLNCYTALDSFISHAKLLGWCNKKSKSDGEGVFEGGVSEEEEEEELISDALERIYKDCFKLLKLNDDGTTSWLKNIATGITASTLYNYSERKREEEEELLKNRLATIEKEISNLPLLHHKEWLSATYMEKNTFGFVVSSNVYCLTGRLWFAETFMIAMTERHFRNQNLLIQSGEIITKGLLKTDPLRQLLSTQSNVTVIMHFWGCLASFETKAVIRLLKHPRIIELFAAPTLLNFIRHRNVINFYLKVFESGFSELHEKDEDEIMNPLQASSYCFYQPIFARVYLGLIQYYLNNNKSDDESNLKREGYEIKLRDRLKVWREATMMKNNEYIYEPEYFRIIGELERNEETIVKSLELAEIRQQPPFALKSALTLSTIFNKPNHLKRLSLKYESLFKYYELFGNSSELWQQVEKELKKI